jgi:hypothetical protein
MFDNFHIIYSPVAGSRGSKLLIPKLASINNLQPVPPIS